VLPTAGSKLTDSGITTRMEAMRMNRDIRQFRSRVLWGDLRNFKEHKQAGAYLAENTPNPCSMRRQNIIQLSAKHQEKIVRDTAVWR
jgi:hypothetical protein